MPEYICSSCGLAFEAEPDQDGKIVCTNKENIHTHLCEGME